MQMEHPRWYGVAAITSLLLAGCAASSDAESVAPASLVKVQCMTSSTSDLGPCQARASQLCDGTARLRGIDSRSDAGSTGPTGKYQLYHISASYECIKRETQPAS
ncbi:Uncharacterised protein [Bordetella ansorpii]|uniref:Lipoprotein n=1 Tax=Bordetella ansorpii TaxID=288768 RepID=A0A157QMY1_9BORD|nr:hypothetical protein [Bordetella ansorpii]SAI46974.1 Uncharacterised protein [Bordetella ansorpii]